MPRRIVHARELLANGSRFASTSGRASELSLNATAVFPAVSSDGGVGRGARAGDDGIQGFAHDERAEREAVLHERINRDLQIAGGNAQHGQPAGIGGHVRIERALHRPQRAEPGATWNGWRSRPDSSDHAPGVVGGGEKIGVHVERELAELILDLAHIGRGRRGAAIGLELEGLERILKGGRLRDEARRGEHLPSVASPEAVGACAGFARAAG